MPGEMTVAQAAESLGVSKRRVQKLIADGRLKARLVGIQFLLDPKDVKAFAAIPRVGGRPRKNPSDAATPAKRGRMK